jgi:hypothetical protein
MTEEQSQVHVTVMVRAQNRQTVILMLLWVTTILCDGFIANKRTDNLTAPYESTLLDGHYLSDGVGPFATADMCTGVATIGINVT